MKISELINLISLKLNRNFTQSDLARGLDITRQSVSNRIRNNSEVTISELQKIEEYIGIKLFETKFRNDGLVKVDFYPDVFASCGPGEIVFSEEKDVVNLPISLIHGYSETKKYSMICAKGDSMTPFISNGDKLIVEHIDNNEITDNKIYVFCYKTDVFVKRLSKNLDELIIKSDNQNYGIKIIKTDELNDIRIIGRIVGIVRNI